jgi:WXG100 family type VII secretion target
MAMSGNGVEADLAAVRVAAGHVDDVAAELDRHVRLLMREVRELIGSGWRGDAADTHDDAWNEWHDSAGSLIAALKDEAALLRTTASRYTATDDEAAVELRGLDGPGPS